MRRKFSRILMILLSVLLCTAGCTTNSSQITPLENVDQASGGAADNNSSVDLDSMFTDSRMTLPEDGIVSQEVMEAIAGKDAVFEFYSTDENMHIAYYWSYEGKKIQNAVEQNMKVTFTDDRVDEVKKAANNASVGLGVTLPKENLAAPAKLTVMLSEKWDADMVLLCKLVDGVPERMCDVTVEVKKNSQQEYTTLTFPVSEVGDTYYLVGGKTTVDEEEENNSDDADENTSDNSSSSKDDDGAGSSAAGGSDDQQGNQSDSSDGEVHTCKISIECSTILDNMDKLNKAKSDFVPSDGWILYLSEVEYTPGETVYDVLYRVCRETSIHMEASYTPAYSSYYVEGINQLYEFDCGDLSGWTYSVNGWFPNYGCSKYEVSDGDVIEWRYTCDLGRDVGDQYYGE